MYVQVGSYDPQMYSSDTCLNNRLRQVLFSTLSHSTKHTFDKIYVCSILLQVYMYLKHVLFMSKIKTAEL